MVSLFDILHKPSEWNQISTGVDSLDSLIRVDGSQAILDFQSTPLHNCMFAVVCNMMVSYLELKSDGKIIVLETFNQFPWKLLRKHPRYNELLERCITRYSLPTFSQILAFLMIKRLEKYDCSPFIVIMNFHEVLEYYRLQLVTAFEEALLKLEVDWNTAYIEKLNKTDPATTADKSLPDLPDSTLFRESPFLKFQSHVDVMFKHLNEFATCQQLMILLLGCMDVKMNTLKTGSETEDNYIPAKSNSTVEPSPKMRSKSRFEPTKYDHRQLGNRSLNENKIHQRILFYNDFLINSHYNLDNKDEASKNCDRVVAVAKADKENVAGNIMEPVYFDFMDLGDAENNKNASWLIDLLHSEEEPLSSFLEESIVITQQQLRPSSERQNKRPKMTNDFPSSPVKYSDPTQYSSNSVESPSLMQDSVIEGSDVELTGTVFDEI